MKIIVYLPVRTNPESSLAVVLAKTIEISFITVDMELYFKSSVISHGCTVECLYWYEERNIHTAHLRAERGNKEKIQELIAEGWEGTAKYPIFY